VGKRAEVMPGINQTEVSLATTFIIIVVKGFRRIKDELNL
jgi:hypothetical protein